MPVYVNDIEITDENVHQEMQYHPADSLEEARTEAAKALVIKELLLQEAERLGVTSEKEDDEETLIQALLEQEITIPEPDEDTCRRYYEQHQKAFTNQPLFEAAHILIEADEKDASALAQAEKKALTLIETLTPESFGAVASEHSDCSSNRSQGHLGQLTLDDIIPEFGEALNDMEEGSISRMPVQSCYGYHIIHLIKRINSKSLPFEHVKERIGEYLATSSYRRAISQYIKLLAGKANIIGIEIDQATNPLVQ